jgi:hypothetical protein
VRVVLAAMVVLAHTAQAMAVAVVPGQVHQLQDHQ